MPWYFLVQLRKGAMSGETTHCTTSCTRRHSRTYKRERCPSHLRQPTPTPLGGYMAALGKKGSSLDVAMRLGMFPSRLWVIQHGLSAPSLGEAGKMQERLGIPMQAWLSVPCVRWAVDKNVDPRRIAHSRRVSARKRYLREHPNAEARERLPITAPVRKRTRNWLELPTAPALLASLTEPPPNLVRDDARPT